MTISQLYLTLLRLSLFGGEAPAEMEQQLTSEALSLVARLAKSQDMGHLVFDALQTYYPHLQNEVISSLRQQYMTAIFRNECMTADLNNVCEILEKNAIPHLPLKGAIIRPYYKESWMRTSCDIDLLVREEDLKRAQAIIENDLHFTLECGPNFHDVSLYSPSGTHLELHFSIKEGIAPIDKILERVWEYAAPVCDGSCRFLLSDDFLLFHLIAHTAYHFMHGGCGTKPFFDLYVLEKALPIKEEVFSAFLEESELLPFYQNVRALMRVWFENEPYTDFTRQMADYILRGGTYGSHRHSVAIQKNQQGGKLRFLLFRLFPPFDFLKLRYPTLKKLPFLAPIYYIRRLLSVLMPKRMCRSANALKISATLTKQEDNALNLLLNELGLKDLNTD